MLDQGRHARAGGGRAAIGARGREEGRKERRGGKRKGKMEKKEKEEKEKRKRKRGKRERKRAHVGGIRGGRCDLVATRNVACARGRGHREKVGGWKSDAWNRERFRKMGFRV
jgi:hypothetical protein